MTPPSEVVLLMRLRVLPDIADVAESSNPKHHTLRLGIPGSSRILFSCFQRPSRDVFTRPPICQYADV